MSHDLLKNGFTVRPGHGGSFVVYAIVSDRPENYEVPFWGFSSAADLIKWQQAQLRVQPQQESPQDRLARLRREAQERQGKPIPLPDGNGKRKGIPFFRG